MANKNKKKKKSYLEKDTEKQAKTSELMKYGTPEKYDARGLKSEAYKKRVRDLADIHISHGGEGFSGGGRATHGYGKAYLKGGRVK
tara:strand:+ start:279 stop:536 length:258 start_codon:yes stop_codon:yes gene_type:complete